MSEVDDAPPAVDSVLAVVNNSEAVWLPMLSRSSCGNKEGVPSGFVLVLVTGSLI